MVSARLPRSCGDTVSAADGRDGASNALDPTAGRMHADSLTGEFDAPLHPSPPLRVSAYPSLPPRRPRDIFDLECRGCLSVALKNGDDDMVEVGGRSWEGTENDAWSVSDESQVPVLSRPSSYSSSLPLLLLSSSASLCRCSV